MNPAAINLAKRNTRFFINDDPIEITPRGPEYAADGTGGRVKMDEKDRDPVTVRVIPLTSQARQTLTLEGKEVTVEFILVAMPEDDLRKGDEFEARGRKFKIIHIQEKRLYQLKAELITVG